MTKKLELYKCNVCGNIVEVLFSGIGDLVCCGEKMEHLVPQNSDNEVELTEKHTPEINTYDEGTVVSVLKHPMIKEHYIMMIQAESENKNEVHIKYFYPDDTAEINLPEIKNISSAISYCNIHGLYKGTRDDVTADK